MSSKYTRETRYQAAAAMVAHGNSLAVADQTGIPASTLRYWHRNDEEFQSMCQEVWVEFGDGIKSKLAAIIDESADQALDRLKNGDVVRDNRTGDLVRVPIKGRDAAIVGAVAFDKLRLAENQPTSIVAKSNDVKALAEQFAKLSEQWQEKQATTIIDMQEEK
jgi:hypothetical protein